MSDLPREADVAVVGGGLAGLLFTALAAASPAAQSRRFVVLEARPPHQRAPDADLDLRMSALSPASCELLRAAGVWSELPSPVVNPYTRMVVWQGEYAAGRRIAFDASEVGAPDLGVIAENNAIRLALWSRLAELPNVTLCPMPPAESLIEQDAACALSFADGQTLHARLVIGADGPRSWVRTQLDVRHTEKAYGQSGVVAHIQAEQPHASTAWQRFLDAGPVALLPLADGRLSLVWSCPTEQATELCEADESDFNAALTAATEEVLGKLACTSTRAAFPLSLGYAHRYTGQRFALIGDAAHRVHPLAGQGANLGLQDAAELAAQLAAHLQLKHADPGDPRMLRRYERARKGQNLGTMATMDAFHRAFTSSARDLAGAAMRIVDQAPPLKGRFARSAMGL